MNRRWSNCGRHLFLIRQKKGSNLSAVSAVRSCTHPAAGRGPLGADTACACMMVNNSNICGDIHVSGMQAGGAPVTATNSRQSGNRAVNIDRGGGNEGGKGSLVAAPLTLCLTLLSPLLPLLPHRRTGGGGKGQVPTAVTYS